MADSGNHPILKLGVLISGRGSNLQALIDACARPDYPARIALVISNRADAYGLVRAQEAGIATRVIAPRDYSDRAAFDAALTAALVTAQVDLVCLAGFMRLLTPDFVTRWYNRLINIHPSLLPAYKGLDTHARVLAAGEAESGCSVHFVRAAMDDGPLILQARVPVLPGDDPERLAARVLEQEHRCYPLAVELIACGRLRLDDKTVHLSGDLPEGITVPV